MRSTRFLVVVGLVFAAVLSTSSPASALSCVAPPPSVAEVTITGDVPHEGWYGEAEVPAIVGRVVEGTGAQPEAVGDRLALVEVIAALRLDAVPAEVEIVADDLIGWGHPTYAEGDHVFLRLTEWSMPSGEPSGGIADGPCSWNDRYSAAEIDVLLDLAETHDVPLVEPVPIVEETPPTTTTVAPSAPPSSSPPSTTESPAEPGEVPVDDAEPIPTTEDDGEDDGLSTVALVGIAAIALLVVGAAGYAVSNRR